MNRENGRYRRKRRRKRKKGKEREKKETRAREDRGEARSASHKALHPPLCRHKQPLYGVSSETASRKTERKTERDRKGEPVEWRGVGSETCPRNS